MHTESGVFTILIFTILSIGIVGPTIRITAMDIHPCITLIIPGVWDLEVAGTHRTEVGDGVIRLIIAIITILIITVDMADTADITIIIMDMADITTLGIMALPAIPDMVKGDQPEQVY